MTFVTELEAKLHAALVELRDDFDAMIKQFRSSAAVTDDQLQASRDKAHAAIEGDAAVQEPGVQEPAAAGTGDAAVQAADLGTGAALSTDTGGTVATEQPTA